MEYGALVKNVSVGYLRAGHLGVSGSPLLSIANSPEGTIRATPGTHALYVRISLLGALTSYVGNFPRIVVYGAVSNLGLRYKWNEVLLTIRF